MQKVVGTDVVLLVQMVVGVLEQMVEDVAAFTVQVVVASFVIAALN